MQIDRYTKLVLTVIAVALTALAVGQFILPQPAEMAIAGSGGAVWVTAPSGQVWFCVAGGECTLIGAAR